MQKENKSVFITRRKILQRYSFKKEDSSGTYYQQIEKVQDNERILETN
jgi:hypothetical protein